MDMPETPPKRPMGRPASNLPPLSLHIPEPRYRPGDTPDFSDVEIPAVDATPRPGEATKADAMRELCYGLVRVLDFDGQAKGPCNPNLARSEEHTSELQSLMRISYAVFCLKIQHHTVS